MREYIVTISALDPSGVQEDLMFSINGFVNQNPYAGAVGYYEARVVSPISKNIDMFSAGTTSGYNQIGYGYLELSNTDGGLDYLTEYTLVDRFISAKYFDTDSPTTTMAGRLNGYVDSCNFSTDRLVINIKDVSKILDTPLALETYGGTNVLPDGLDGTDDIKGQVKPRLYGSVLNISPVMVNTSKLIYQVSLDGFDIVSNVYDMGVVLTNYGTNYTTLVDLEATAPPAGQYRVYSGTGGCFFRLGAYPPGGVAFPAGAITCDAENYDATNPTEYNYIKNVVHRLINSIESKTFAGFMSVTSYPYDYETGIYITDSITAISAISDILDSITGFLVFSELDPNFYLLGLLENPLSSTVNMFITQPDVMSIERVETGDSNKGIASWKQTLSYAKNYTVQNDSDLAASVTNAKRNVLKREFLSASEISMPVLYENPLSPEISKNTLILNQSDVLIELARIATLYNVGRVLFKIELPIIDYSPLPEIAYVVNLTFNRFGLQLGKNFIVLGVMYDYPAMKYKLTLWG